MASNNNVFPSYLKWIIHPPFLHGETMEAKFHHKSKTVAKWHVTLSFEKHRLDEWHLKLYLIFDGTEEIVAHNLTRRISIGENCIVNWNVPASRFNQDNHYKCYLETLAFIPRMKPEQMLVEIRMSLAEDLEIHILPPRKDLNRLVRDLSNLSIAPRYHDVDLKSAGLIVYRAHSYILDMRWKNLYSFPPLYEAVKREIRTNISSYLLRHILFYMYTGLFIRNFPHWDKPEYLAELFQVIERYNITHLRDSLDLSDSSQLRESKKAALTLSYVFRLPFVNDRPVEDASLSLPPQVLSNTLREQNLRNQVKFEIRVRMVGGAGAWLSFSLSSKAKDRIHAQVELVLSKMVMQIVSGKHSREFIGSILAHQDNYSIGPRRSIESGPVLFLGCPETFGDLTTTGYFGRIEQWLRFNITIMDGTSIDEFQSFNSNLPNNLGKFNTLVEHMSELSQGHISDLGLKSRCSSGSNVQAIGRVHRAIVDTRIPRLHEVLVGFQEGQNLSTDATIDLSEEALPFVVEYIYTAKFPDVPQPLLEEISNFAKKGNLKCLSDLIDDMHNRLEE